MSKVLIYSQEDLDLILELKKEENEELQQGNEKLKDNWNKLKEYIGAEWYCYDNESVECEVARDILNKMQELQGSRE